MFLGCRGFFRKIESHFCEMKCDETLPFRIDPGRIGTFIGILYQQRQKLIVDSDREFSRNL
ncbi:MAG: hypothetical protein HC900_09775 [Methylacidiphilales bacterium]|nr:hypothetical protein [Candidatus Methylacidiphilales bacterium]